jgi:hypothetical protein
MPDLHENEASAKGAGDAAQHRFGKAIPGETVESSSKPIIDYAPLSGRNAPTQFARAVRVAIIEQFVFLLLAAITLDGGMLLRGFSVAAVVFWVVTAVVFLKRRSSPSRGDLFFVNAGYPVMAVAAALIGMWISDMSR